VAALAYLVPPISGLIAYLRAPDMRTRAHGLQAIAFGLLWPVLLYGGSALSERATQVVFAVGAILWLTLGIAAGLGRGVMVTFFERLASASVYDSD
jgi:hypothetical protein